MIHCRGCRARLVRHVSSTRAARRAAPSDSAGDVAARRYYSCCAVSDRMTHRQQCRPLVASAPTPHNNNQYNIRLRRSGQPDVTIPGLDLRLGRWRTG